MWSNRGEKWWVCDVCNNDVSLTFNYISDNKIISYCDRCNDSEINITGIAYRHSISWIWCDTNMHKYGDQMKKL